jgi:hypothetical protein
VLLYISAGVERGGGGDACLIGADGVGLAFCPVTGYAWRDTVVTLHGSNFAAGTYEQRYNCLLAIFHQLLIAPLFTIFSQLNEYIGVDARADALCQSPLRFVTRTALTCELRAREPQASVDVTLTTVGGVSARSLVVSYAFVPELQEIEALLTPTTSAPDVTDATTATEVDGSAENGDDGVASSSACAPRTDGLFGLQNCPYDVDVTLRIRGTAFGGRLTLFILHCF